MELFCISRSHDFLQVHVDKLKNVLGITCDPRLFDTILKSIQVLPDEIFSIILAGIFALKTCDHVQVKRVRVPSKVKTKFKFE